MKTYTMSKAGLFTTIAIITVGIVDLCFVCFGGEGSSISNYLVNATSYSPLFTFALAFTCGHLIAGMTPDYSRLKSAWDAYKEIMRVSLSNHSEVEELSAAIEELVNRPVGITRYFRGKK